MRRGIGVGYVQRRTAQQQQLSSLGDSLEADRIGALANEIDGVRAALRRFVAEHRDAITADVVLTARLRQIAAALGDDLLGARERVLSQSLGPAPFHAALASEVIAICRREAVVYGSVVPMRRVLAALRQEQEGSQAAQHITPRDVAAGLASLRPLGSAYECVGTDQDGFVCRGGSGSADSRTVLDAVTAAVKQRRRVASGASQQDAAHRRAIASYSLHRGPISQGTPSTSASALSPSRTARDPAEAAAGPSPPEQVPNTAAAAATDELRAVVAFSFEQIRAALPVAWSQASYAQRLHAALEALMADGVVWVDVDPRQVGANTPGPLCHMSVLAVKAEAPPVAPVAQAATFVSGGRGSVVSPAAAMQHPATALHQHPAVTFWFMPLL